MDGDVVEYISRLSGALEDYYVQKENHFEEGTEEREAVEEAIGDIRKAFAYFERVTDTATEFIDDVINKGLDKE